MKMISVDVLMNIWEKYKIPKDVRAEKEIEKWTHDIAQWCDWLEPDKVPPPDNEKVLVIIEGSLGTIKIRNGRFLARFNKAIGWILEDVDSDYLDFTVKRWTMLPEVPKELRSDRNGQ